MLLIPLLPIVLWWFKQGRIFALLCILSLSTTSLDAFESDFFKNSEQCGKEAFDKGDFEAAIRSFQDPYRKGVSYYKAGNFVEAENAFRQSTLPETSIQAAYNLGNALAQQQKFKEAVSAYEEVLKQQPDHTKAKDNLELIKKLLEQQKQESSQSDNQDQDNQNQQNQDKSQEKDSKDKDQSNPPSHRPKK